MITESIALTQNESNAIKPAFSAHTRSLSLVILARFGHETRCVEKLLKARKITRKENQEHSKGKYNRLRAPLTNDSLLLHSALPTGVLYENASLFEQKAGKTTRENSSSRRTQTRNGKCYTQMWEIDRVCVSDEQ